MFTEQGWSYWLVWSIYVAVGLSLLAMLYYPVRKFNRWVLLFLFTPIAALMFTPITIQPDSKYWAPAALVMIFEIEKAGIEGFVRGLIPLILSYFGLLLLGIGWLLKPKKKHPSSPTIDEANPPLMQPTSKKQPTLDELDLD